MTKNTTKPAGTRRRAIALPVAIVVASGASLVALTSGAWFTDSATVGPNTFSTGNIALSATPASSAISMTNMAPGDAAYGTITVRNDGSLAAKYNLSGQVTGTAQSALRTTVKTGVSACSAAGFDATGTSVYAAGAIPTGKTLLGARPALAASATEVLCFKVELPGASTNDTFQNTTATAVFTFDSTQVAAP